MTLALLYIDSFSSKPFEGFKEEMAAHNIDCEVQNRSGEMVYGALEAYIPTAIILWMSAQYFGPMFKKLGEEHYPAFKKAFGKLYNNSNDINVDLIGSKGKISGKYPYSMTLSIEATTDTDIRFKLVFQKNLSKQEVNQVLDIFTSFMSNFHANTLDEKAQNELKSARMVGKQIIAVANLETNRIEFPDPITGY